MSNFNLFEKGWTNIVFENRNKAYGAYKLRNESAKTMLLALLLGVGVLGIVFGSSHLYASKNRGEIVIVYGNDDPVAPEIIDPIEHKPLIEDEVPKGTGDDTEVTTAMVKDVMKNIKHTDVTVKEDANVTTNDLAANDDFDDDTQSGLTTTDAHTDGTLNTSGVRSGNENIETNVTTSVTERGSGLAENAIVKLVQKKAAPADGCQKFFDSFVRKFSKNDVAGNVSEITIKLKFVVEKDGSFSDIQIIEDQFGLGNEAVRVLKTMPKWHPAQHNGKTVRSSFVLPIKVKVNN